jgi:chemotaxis protein MotB
MARTLTWIGIAALSLTLTGCVAADQYNALKLDRDGLAAQFAQAQTDLSAAQAQVRTLSDQLKLVSDNGGTNGALIANLTARLAAAEKERDDALAKYADAVRNGGNQIASPLPAQLTSELQAFAAQNPNLVDFNSALGIVKFKSDLTFAPGEADLTPQAREVIRKFSTILNSSGAAPYELVVAGHTDNTPVVNPATTAKGNKDNWYLSSHRALSVTEALIQDGVNPGRIGATGYADCRPIASNSTAAGKQQNRRVEVLILPNAVRTAMMASHTEGPAKAVRNKAPAQLNKDQPFQNK